MSNRVHLFAAIALILGATGANAAPVSVDAASGLGNRPSIGITSSTTTRPYTGIGTQNALLPYFSFSARQFYVRGINVGYTAVNNDRFGLDVVAVPRFLGYGNDDSPELETQVSTNYSLHAGLSLTVPLRNFQLNTQLLTDVLNESGGSEITSTLSRTFTFNALSVTAAGSLNWQDSSLVDHYYGVRNSGGSNTAPTNYVAGSTTNLRASITSAYPVNDSLTVIGSASFTRYGEEIVDSPIVDNETTTAVTLGIVYSFGH